ncbi:nucleosidase [Campylobacter novaezeelandiae]|uniref:Nucleosidase n=1 Tax=Campylobacter novaezeelandiae TaxID=2267891 RepID=A0A4Q9JVE7_9BACT|nr:MotE family protein [Campylobacter novaezeelandiae]MBK1963411.1 MotE family protein [Campylobacter novaezeelandiae]MBK1992877.1 MotE family protein [Campylobacter novaezeelandiae]QWU80710.1 putative motility protein chaperone MotE [Campylobacter novaezeelandiae]TBR78812.1 nucleosidase [Campylobacter novaezeelandiae]TBR80416.1 nucleosidase [Campylobacter novaezeelandiae]
MSRIIFSFFLLVLSLQAEQNCEQYFESKKAQLELQTREFDEARQSLEAFKASFEALQKEKMQELATKEAEVNATLAQIDSLKKENARLLEEKKKILDTINEKTEGRVKEIYSQMKDAAIANVLSQMDAEDASKIMLSLESRKISGVLSKMDPKKASELTLLLKNMDNNTSSN